ncbi:N-acetyltransferase [Bradyrhizobium lablabi]|nr:N-acetyltransferase [Bradyrhizobium lablabi]
MIDNFRDNQALSRFELDVGGKVAFVVYRKSPGAITLVHTEVPPELGGQGIGSKLGRAALDAVRTQRRELTVECDFIRSFMKKYPEYDDLLASDDGSASGKPPAS